MAKKGIEIEKKDYQPRKAIKEFKDLAYKEFACVKIRGESFLQHMIRKMIGLCLYAGMNQKTNELISIALKSCKDEDLIHVPLAPAEGLLLVAPDFSN